jgi:hypothetical protein
MANPSMKKMMLYFNNYNKIMMIDSTGKQVKEVGNASAASGLDYHLGKWRRRKLFWEKRKVFVYNQAKCFRRLFKVTAGVMCLTCNANYSEFFQNNGSWSILFDD